MTLVLNAEKTSFREATPRPASRQGIDSEDGSGPAPDLSSMILSLGKNPSRNIVSLLESGAQFLNCSHLNYVETTDKSEEELRDEKATKIPVKGITRELWLYGLCSEPDLEKISIFTALLSQQEQLLREVNRLRNLKDYSKKLFECCPDGIVVCDAGGTIINTNRAMVSMTHRPTESLIGLKASQLATREGRSLAFQAARKLKKQSICRFNCRLKIRPGLTIPVSVRFSDFTFQGQYLLLASVRDLSNSEEETQKCNTYEQSLKRSFSQCHRRLHPLRPIWPHHRSESPCRANDRYLCGTSKGASC